MGEAGCCSVGGEKGIVLDAAGAYFAFLYPEKRGVVGVTTYVQRAVGCHFDINIFFVWRFFVLLYYNNSSCLEPRWFCGC